MEPLARETPSGLRTWEEVKTKLASIAQRACRDREAKFTSLAHLMNKATLEEAYSRLSDTAAPGIDKETKETYGKELAENLDDLIKRLKRDAYRPAPARRKYIAKPGSDKKRPLGILILEDKIVLTALEIILESVYEQDFLPCSFGFRPGLSCHDALKELSRKIGLKKVNYIVDADIRGFFDHVDHECLIKLLQHRISDTKIIRLIRRFLKAGIMEDGKYFKTDEGVPQGSLCKALHNPPYAK
jgi:RNA-directed DNA polymerase